MRERETEKEIENFLSKLGRRVVEELLHTCAHTRL